MDNIYNMNNVTQCRNNRDNPDILNPSLGFNLSGIKMVLCIEG